ncbi:MAG: 4-(cytidine 5'-diphospho)-2-C-methyl-D-erythritol kinase [Bacteroidota bacterium]|nr:4-(cytidine 5'-diphospho)-2-C-methyl-D-erythritol kinase [Candidatus Kapabacteria bacterium]MDW8221161.1 4-(cytidine 5'-diphospho)-2-C-methyl-D-erythritol kinase [Bacteroidota bacterium]
MHAVATLSHAKINLGLEVLYKRPDNFHEINTVFVRISLADTILVSSNTTFNQIHIDCTPDLGIADTENLAYKAVYQAQRAAFARGIVHVPSISITLRKQIPYGGGLGGGSSNAGAVLRSLPSLWENNTLTHTDYREVATSIGSDVPFFLEHMDCAFASGRGEVLQPLALKLPYYVVVVTPNIRITTAWAYAALKRGSQEEERRTPTDYTALLQDALTSPNKLRQHFTNDFEEVIFAEYPIIGGIKQYLYESGALFALMSGSGSSVFGLFRTDTEAHAVAATIPQRFEESIVHVCRPL